MTFFHGEKNQRFSLFQKVAGIPLLVPGISEVLHVPGFIRKLDIGIIVAVAAGPDVLQEEAGPAAGVEDLLLTLPVSDRYVYHR